MTSFLRNISNNMIMHKVLTLVSILSRNLSMIVPMQLEFLPLFVNVIQQPTSPAYEATDIRSVTVDILTCFVMFAQTPLNNTLIEQGFLTIVRNMHMFNEIPLLQVKYICKQINTCNYCLAIVTSLFLSLKQKIDVFYILFFSRVLRNVSRHS